MKPTALALLAASLLTACASSDLERRAAAERAAVERSSAERTAAAERAAKTTSETMTVTVTRPADVMAAPAADMAEIAAAAAASPTDQHDWLQQLVGDWTFDCKANMGEGQPALEASGTESVRPVGGLWIVAEGRSTMFGQPIQSQMTLGYNPEAKAFVGTWLDSSQTQLWSYKGTLDAATNTLALDTEGPSFDDPSRTSHYRDAIQLTDKDHKVLTSSVQNPDGSWTTFMRAEFTRKQ